MTNNVEDLLRVSMESISDVISTKTVIGDPIVDTEELKIIPLTDIKLSFVTGGTNQDKEEEGSKKLFGGATGGSLKVLSKAFMVVRNTEVEIIMIENTSDDVMTKVIKSVPRALELLDEYMTKKQEDNI